MQRNWLGCSARRRSALARTGHAADLTVWGLQAFNPQADAYIGELVEEYGKAKGIDAEYVVVPANVLNERLAAAFEAGAPPDAFMTGRRAGPVLHAAGPDRSPLDDVLADMREVRAASTRTPCRRRLYEGSVQALPIEVDVVADVRAQGPAREGRREAARDLGGAARGLARRSRRPTRLSRRSACRSATPTTPRARSGRSSGRSAAPMFAEDGKTITFNSPETQAAYQFLADMVGRGDDPAQRAHLGRRRQQQRLPDRPRRLHHQPAQRLSRGCRRTTRSSSPTPR